MFGGRDLDHPHPAVTVDLGPGTSCEGDTLSGLENVVGTIYDDTLIGDGGKNKLSGSFGSDILRGRGGDDRLAGQAGADTANGGTGTDWCGAEIERNCELPAGSDRGPGQAPLDPDGHHRLALSPSGAVAAA
jgi:RTX calcium-binding nonapeptide repeat (4 copies)